KGKAVREADTARLIASEHADLGEVGAAYAAGMVSRAHVDIAVRVHRQLGPVVRDEPRPVVDPVTGEIVQRRTIEVVDVLLAQFGRDFTVPEFDRVAKRIVENLN